LEFPQVFTANFLECRLQPGRGLVFRNNLKENDMNSSVTLRCAAVLLGSLLCGSALADDATSRTPSKAVNYSDLNLKSQAGVTALYKRIANAASAVCQLPQGTDQIVIESELKACKADTTDRAVMQVNLPALTAMHFQKTGRKVDAATYAARQ
jgi:UrcA family protein